MKNSLKSPALPWSSLTTSAPGDIRIGPIQAIPAVLAGLGVSPLQAFAEAGVDPQLFLDPDNRIQIDVLGRLLDSCVTLTGCTHFGLLVGERSGLHALGPLGFLLRNSATVGEAIHNLLLHLHLHDRGAAPLLLTADPDSVLLGYSVLHHGTPAIAPILDTAIAIGYGILRELCGPTWKALHIQFAHNQPDNSEAYRRIFRLNVRFEAEVSGIAFGAAWLDRPIEGADATLHDRANRMFRDAQASVPMRFADQVERVLPQMVLSGMASAEAIGRLFAVHERTLRRRLEAEGKNLRQLINQAQHELAQQLLRNTALSVSAIATALHYDDPNAFSRAFRNWASVSPTQWRSKK